ncbi:hypothetical protein BGW80DRAFT_1330108, partial [Lactifluus volemus]
HSRFIFLRTLFSSSRPALPCNSFDRSLRAHNRIMNAISDLPEDIQSRFHNKAFMWFALLPIYQISEARMIGGSDFPYPGHTLARLVVMTRDVPFYHVSGLTSGSMNSMSNWLHSDPLIIDLSSLPSLSASLTDPNSSISFDQISPIELRPKR